MHSKYSGDQDSVIPLTGSRKLVHGLAEELGLSTTVPYRVWFQGQQVRKIAQTWKVTGILKAESVFEWSMARLTMVLDFSGGWLDSSLWECSVVCNHKRCIPWSSIFAAREIARSLPSFLTQPTAARKLLIRSRSVLQYTIKWVPRLW